jgi:hypothetical protein
MKGHLEALLELRFCTKPSNSGVEAHMEALAGVALMGHDPDILFTIQVTHSNFSLNFYTIMT